MEVTKIKRFKLRDNAEEIIGRRVQKGNSSYICKDALSSMHIFPSPEEVSIDIGFPEDLSKWNDCDYVLVIDEDYLQPYVPFYRALNGKLEGDAPKLLNTVIEKYNKSMSELEFLEEIV